MDQNQNAGDADKTYKVREGFSLSLANGLLIAAGAVLSLGDAEAALHAHKIEEVDGEAEAARLAALAAAAAGADREADLKRLASALENVAALKAQLKDANDALAAARKGASDSDARAKGAEDALAKAQADAQAVAEARAKAEADAKVKADADAAKGGAGGEGTSTGAP